jgi:tRNA-specific 2-thiouridylase
MNSAFDEHMNLLPGEFILQEYFADRSHQGDVLEGSFVGAAGGAACGDVARLSIVLDQREGEIGQETFISAISFATEGCAATRAACACVCEMVEGMSFLDAALISHKEIDSELGGLSPIRKHAAQLVADALHKALSAAASSGLQISDPVENRVLVAVSGGVDSAVAALKERERGADVLAVTVKLWTDPDTDGEKACCSPEAVLGAREVTHSLGIPHLTLDLEEVFREKVVGSFLDGYRNGTTPNPCVLCNGDVRISAMVDLADQLGAEKLITGHYAKVVRDSEGALIGAGDDPAKDQSYMLSGLPTDVIARLEFPLAETTKSEVREIAERNGLSVAKKPESQDLCFLAGQKKQNFLARHGGITDNPGDIVDSEGNTLGQHQGHHNFTVGQRKGLGVSASEPLYVIETNGSDNTVRVGTKTELESETVKIKKVTLHRNGSRVSKVRLRYHSEPVPVQLDAEAGEHSQLDLTLLGKTLSNVPGQAAVLMDEDDVVVGHGTITGKRAKV